MQPFITHTGIAVPLLKDDINTDQIAGDASVRLRGGKLVARNAKGKRLSAVPRQLRDGEVAGQLEALRDWLAEHDRACQTAVEQWMLRSLPVPVIGRIEAGRVILDLRCLEDEAEFAGQLGRIREPA